MTTTPSPSDKHPIMAEAAEKPVAWRVRGYAQFKTSAPGPWRYVDGAERPRVNIPQDCDLEPLYAAPLPLLDRARQALEEIIALRDMKLRLRNLHAMGHGTDWENYYARKPVAYDFARAILAELEEHMKGKTNEVQHR